MRRVTIILFFILIFCSCQVENKTTVLQDQAPEKIADGWETAAPAEVGVDPNLLEKMVDELEKNSPDTLHSIVIVKDGKLIFERYDNGYSRSKRQDIASVTKSVTSLLIGIAIEQGAIEGVDQPVGELLPEYANLIATDPAKKELTLQHILTMSSGLEWDEQSYPYSDRRNDANAMKYNSDGTRFVLERPVVNEPGSQFQYAGANSLLLSAIIKSTTGMNAGDYAANYLFRPLGITDYVWHSYRDGLTDTDGGLSLSPRDMAKIGYLTVNDGQWNGKQLISPQWIEESTRGHIPAVAGADYGYQWWLAKTPVKFQRVNSYFASGYGGQKIQVYPDLDAVVIITHDWSGEGESEFLNLRLLGEYILPAILPTYYLDWIIWLWPTAVLISLSLLLWVLIKRRTTAALLWPLWCVIVLLFGPLGLLAYLASTRHAHDEKPYWPHALAASLSCTTGNALGMTALLLYLVLVQPATDIFIFSLLLPFLIGWLLFRAPMLRYVTHAGIGFSLRRALFNELITTCLVLAGMLSSIIYLQTLWFPFSNFTLDNPMFWAMIVLASFAGVLVVYPYNYWLARHGYRLGPVTAAAKDGAEQEEEIAAPKLRRVWWAVPLSIAVLATSLGLAISSVS